MRIDRRKFLKAMGAMGLAVPLGCKREGAAPAGGGGTSESGGGRTLFEKIMAKGEKDKEVAKGAPKQTPGKPAAGAGGAPSATATATATAAKPRRKPVSKKVVEAFRKARARMVGARPKGKKGKRKTTRPLPDEPVVCAEWQAQCGGGSSCTAEFGEKCVNGCCVTPCQHDAQCYGWSCVEGECFPTASEYAGVEEYAPYEGGYPPVEE